MTLFAVTGANGFIGRHLLEALAASGQQIRALTRRSPEHGSQAGNVEWVIGDIAEPASWRRLLEPGCVAINLAHSHTLTGSAAIEATRRMIESCAAARIDRLVHCSTVSVYGRANETALTEASVRNPLNEYGRIKLAVEEELTDGTRERFGLVIVRPSEVFGAGGEALVKLVNDLKDGSRVINYLRSSVFGRRRTHLVAVETVVSALRFLSTPSLSVDAETFIVSDDDDPLNNFQDVERILMEELGVPPHAVAPLPLPTQLLETLLRLRGRVNVNTRAEYRPEKLHSWGFTKPVTLESALRRFAAGHRSRRGR